MTMRTLVVHLGGIGDFLLACPAVAHLAKDGPVELLGRAERLQLAVAGGVAEAAHDFDAVDFSSVFSRPTPRLREFLEPFDRAVIWIRDAAPVEQAFREAGIPGVASFPGLPPGNWARHASEYYLDCLHAPPAPPIRLYLPEETPPMDIVIHPGSGGQRKNWPFENFVALAEALTRAGRYVTWCRGPAEERFAYPEDAPLLSIHSLHELGRILSNTRIYIGNDSGITHLAAAVDCATIAIFGPTRPEIWAPIGPCVHIAQGNPWPAWPNVYAMCRDIT